MNTLNSIFALTQKDWLRFSRQPFMIAISVIIPLLFIFHYSIIIPVSATNPIVVAMESEDAAAQQFLNTLCEIHSQEARYYEIITTNPLRARQMFKAGDVLGLIVIPEDFDTRLAVNTAQVELHLNNINSDYSKNLRLRLDHAVRQFRTHQFGSIVNIDETRILSQDPAMQAYSNINLLLFACLYSSMLNTGLQIASEWNERTVKTLLLAPVNRGTIAAGKIISGLGQSLPSIGLTTLILVYFFNFRPRGTFWEMAGIMGAVMLLGAGLGAMAGTACKRTLPTTSILIATAIVFFLVSGNEDTLRGLAWDGPVVLLWKIARILPTTYAFLAARSLFLTGETTTLLRDLSIVSAAIITVISGAIFLLYRSYSKLPGGQ